MLVLSRKRTPYINLNFALPSTFNREVFEIRLRSYDYTRHTRLQALYLFSPLFSKLSAPVYKAVDEPFDPVSGYFLLDSLYLI